MKTRNLLLVALLTCMGCALYGQGSSGPRGASSTPSAGTGPSVIVRPPLAPPPEKIGPKSPKDIKQQPVFQPQQAPQMSFRPIFFEPGILNLQGGGFVGVDHLYNVSGNIPVVVEIVKSPNVISNITNEKVEADIAKMFEKEGISLEIKPTDGPTLPFFQVLVMIVPAGDGVSAFCAGRLFEKVELDRVALPVGVYFQAITWEHQTMIFASKADSEKQIDGAISDVVQHFLERYRYYKNIAPK